MKKQKKYTKSSKEMRQLAKSLKGKNWQDGLFTSNWPAEFAEYIPKKEEDDLANEQPVYFLDNEFGETWFQTTDKKIAKQMLKMDKGKNYLRIWNPRVKDNEIIASERRQNNRIQMMSSGRSK